MKYLILGFLLLAKWILRLSSGGIFEYNNCGLNLAKRRTTELPFLFSFSQWHLLQALFKYGGYHQLGYS